MAPVLMKSVNQIFFGMNRQTGFTRGVVEAVRDVSVTGGERQRNVFLGDIKPTAVSAKP
jgi:hypothetical protein